MEIVFLLSFLLVFGQFRQLRCLSTAALDLGCDSIKIGIARLSLSISIASDQLGRKIIPSAVYIKDDRILFGWDALNMMPYDPMDVYLHIPCLIGKQFNDDSVQIYLRQFSYYNMKEDPLTNALYYINTRNEKYSVEELLALILDNFMKLANEGIAKMYPNRYFSDVPFNSRTAVITIPSSFKQREKTILLHICKMVNISLLQILESNTAALLTMTSNYLKIGKMEGTFGIIDIGFEHIQMTLANVKKVRTTFKGYSFATSKIKIISSSFKSNVGVKKILYEMQTYFNLKIQKEMHSKNIIVIDHPKFVSKLYMGCVKLLQVVSVSQDANVMVKGLFDRSDYKLSLNSTEFFILINNTLKGVENVIKSTLRSAKEFWLIPKHLIVIGGGRFLPYIDYTIQNNLKKVPILKVLDPFFSVVWGATYQASNIAPGFFNFPIILPNKTFRSAMMQIKRNNAVKEKKITFKLKKSLSVFSGLLRKMKYSFNFSTYFKPLAVEGNLNVHLKAIEPILVHDIYVHDVENTIKKMNILNNTEINDLVPPIHVFKGVEIIYSCDINSIISLESVSALFAKRSTFNITSLENPEELLNDSKRIVIENVKLELVHVKLNYTSVPPYHVMSKEAMEQTMNRIDNLKSKSKEYFEKEGVRNELQFYVTDIKRKFNEEDYIICTNDMEKVKIWSFLDDTSRWIKSHITQEINKKEYFNKFDHLLNLTYKVDIRVHEIRNRPILLKRLRQLLETTQHFIMNMFVTSGSGESSKGIFTKNETKDLRRVNKETRMWLIDFNDKFKTIKPNDDPPILCDEIIERITLLETDHNRLLALMEQRTDPNAKENRGSDQTLIENSSTATDDTKNEEAKHIVREDNKITVSGDKVPNIINEKKESQCLKQERDEGDISTSKKSCNES